MMKKVIQFFIDWSFDLLQAPVYGDFLFVFHLFRDQQAKNLPTQTPLSEEDFKFQVDQINELSCNSIVLKNVSSNKVQIDWINKLALLFLLDQIDSCHSSISIINTPLPPTTTDANSLAQVMMWQNSDNDIYNLTTRKSQLSELNKILSHPSCFHFLKRDKHINTSSPKPFFEICQQQDHIHYALRVLGSALNDDSENLNLNLLKLDCFNHKIHYVPIIRSQTDVKLGDCSYLDTCHKSRTCRYLHYKQIFKSPEVSSAQRELDIEKACQISDFTFGEPQLPPQWINCDIRKLDFSILGKFSAIIADPPWNIHMVLPYGTCNDSELLNLPMEQLQDEGILLLWVTGRSIEIGRESLSKWGYRMIDELIWIKTNQLSRTVCTGRTGHWLNHSKEHLLVGVKGDPKWAYSGIDTNVIVSATRETSRKPDEVYDMVERIVGTKSRKLEIFGRDHNTRPGWLTIGNQLNGDNIIESDIRAKYHLFTKSQRAK